MSLARAARLGLAAGAGLASALACAALLRALPPLAPTPLAAAPRAWRGPFERKMSRYEARMILGLGEGYDRRDVQRRYHELMQKNHPDKGGSNYLACKVSEARNVLERK